MAAVDLDILNQRLIQYEAVDDTGVERTERDVPSTKMIQRQADTQFAQSVQCFQFCGALAKDLAIPELQFYATGIKRVVLDRIGHG